MRPPRSGRGIRGRSPLPGAVPARAQACARRRAGPAPPPPAAPDAAAAPAGFPPNGPRSGRQAAPRPGRLAALSALPRRRGGALRAPRRAACPLVPGPGAARRRGLPSACGRAAPGPAAPGARRVALSRRSPRPFPPPGSFRSGPRPFPPPGSFRSGPRPFPPPGSFRSGPRPFPPPGSFRSGPPPPPRASSFFFPFPPHSGESAGAPSRRSRGAAPFGPAHRRASRGSRARASSSRPCFHPSRSVPVSPVARRAASSTSSGSPRAPRLPVPRGPRPRAAAAESRLFARAEIGRPRAAAGPVRARGAAGGGRAGLTRSWRRT